MWIEFIWCKIIRGEFLEQLDDYRLKKDSVPRISLNTILQVFVKRFVPWKLEFIVCENSQDLIWSFSEIYSRVSHHEIETDKVALSLDSYWTQFSV
jgi:hypothetical protein